MTVNPASQFAAAISAEREVLVLKVHQDAAKDSPKRRRRRSSSSSRARRRLVEAASRRLEDYSEEVQLVVLAELERRREQGMSGQPSEDGDSIEAGDQTGPPDSLGGVQRLWQGYVSLPVTYWVWGLGGGFAMLVTVALAMVAGGEFVALPAQCLGMAYCLFVLVAVWRSAKRHRGKEIWAQLAQVSVAASAAGTVVRLLFGS